MWYQQATLARSGDTLYVAVRGCSPRSRGYVQMMKTNGDMLGMWENELFDNIQSIATANEGRVFVADFLRVQCFRLNGSFLQLLNESKPNQLFMPDELTVAHSFGLVFVADRINCRIWSFTFEGRLQFRLVIPALRSITTIGDDELVAISGLNVVHVFCARDGVPLREFSVSFLRVNVRVRASPMGTLYFFSDTEDIVYREPDGSIIPVALSNSGLTDVAWDDDGCLIGCARNGDFIRPSFDVDKRFSNKLRELRSLSLRHLQ